MAKRVVWSARALADVESIAAYISSDFSRVRKDCCEEDTVKLTRQFARFPQSGREVPEFQDPSLRELFAYSYRIIYKTETEKVIIASVIHGKRNLS
jgi:toxin ParE1/3/4